MEGEAARTTSDAAAVQVVRVLPGGGTEVVPRAFRALAQLRVAPSGADDVALARLAEPLLLIGGVGAFPRDFRNWAVQLAVDGFEPYVLDVPGKGFLPLADDVAAIRAAIDGVRLRCGAARVHLIGHSKGGVGALAAADHAPEHVASVSTIASPHSGVGSAIMGRAARVVPVPGWVRDLARDSEALVRQATFDGPVVNVHSRSFDLIITPRSAHLERPGVRQVAVEASGPAAVHAALGRTNAVVFQLVRAGLLEAVRAGEGAQATSAALDAS
jgi:pimeloyl-ACP methyl ester carboxylesterase